MNTQYLTNKYTVAFFGNGQIATMHTLSKRVLPFLFDSYEIYLMATTLYNMDNPKDFDCYDNEIMIVDENTCNIYVKRLYDEKYIDDNNNSYSNKAINLMKRSLIRVRMAPFADLSIDHMKFLINAFGIHLF